MPAESPLALVTLLRRRRAPAPRVAAVAGSPLAPIVLLRRRRGLVATPSGPPPAGSPLLPLVILARRRAAVAGALPVAETLFEAVRTHLLALPALGGAGLTEVYKNRPKRGWAFPYMVVNSVSGSDELNTSTSWTRTTEYQFTVLGTDDLQVDAIADAAYRALLPKPPNPRMAFRDGYEVVRWPGYNDRSSEQPGRGPNNQNVWMSSFCYYITTTRQM